MIVKGMQAVDVEVSDEKLLSAFRKIDIPAVDLYHKTMDALRKKFDVPLYAFIDAGSWKTEEDHGHGHYEHTVVTVVRIATSDEIQAVNKARDLYNVLVAQ